MTTLADAKTGDTVILRMRACRHDNSGGTLQLMPISGPGCAVWLSDNRECEIEEPPYMPEDTPGILFEDSDDRLWVTVGYGGCVVSSHLSGRGVRQLADVAAELGPLRPASR